MAAFIIQLVTVLVTAELGLDLDQDHKYCLSIGQQCRFTADCCTGSCSMVEGSLHSFCVAKQEHQIVKRSSGLSNSASTNSSCKSYGQRCSRRRECCSNTCEGICVHAVKDLADYLQLMRSINPGYCLSNDVYCNVDSDCCSRRCLRPKGKLRLTCLARPEDPPDKSFFEAFKSTIKNGGCQPDGQMCMINKDCCSKYCVDIIFPMSVKLYCAPVEVDEKQSNFSSRN